MFGRIELLGDAPDWQPDHERQFFATAARSAVSCARSGSKWAFCARLLFQPTLLVCSSTIARTEYVRALGGLDPEIRLMEDVDLYISAIRVSGGNFLDHTVLHYRIGPHSLMHSPEPSRSQLQDEPTGRQPLRQKYRQQRELFEYHALKIFARATLS
jgi:hypothetical protein